MYAKTLSNHSASYKRLQPARQLPRRHARQQRRENNQEQPHQVAFSADPTASAPQLRGGSHVAIESRGSVRDRTRSGSSKTDSQCSKELKRKTSVATTVVPYVRVVQEDRRLQLGLATTITATAATCATPANWQQHESRSITQGFSSLTASTAPASRGPSRLARG
ncbi:hypothetical protein EDB84DRAFT_1440484 [Lactarius hengduanensis]|nr:hypothetical protein EDB84DRAFT_1440484 [Lactarius hengduanensis]